MNQFKRYRGEPVRLYDLMDSFIVICPKCNGKAEVSIPHQFDYKHGILKCTDCHFSEKAIDKIYYKLSGKVNCINCRTFLNISELAEFKSIPSYVNISCNSCNIINKVSGEWEPFQKKYNNSGIIDPVFGLQLWYQEQVKNHVLWAYNAKHLSEIKNYVESTLRERSTDIFKMTMVEKLPNFIKLSKNRTEVLNAIERMEAAK
ncbi:MAG: hypothetical protein IT267_02700 [Saprospiraceae bacterium]|nr:hypothetical protein [Saprospiraceae bacterium]